METRFKFDIVSEINEVRLDIDIGGNYILSVWQNQWVLVSQHKYNSDAIKIKNILEVESIKMAKIEIEKMDDRINKILAPYYIN